LHSRVRTSLVVKVARLSKSRVKTEAGGSWSPSSSVKDVVVMLEWHRRVLCEWRMRWKALVAIVAASPLPVSAAFSSL
jgi:hypothetical protein